MSFEVNDLGNWVDQFFNYQYVRRNWFFRDGNSEKAIAAYSSVEQLSKKSDITEKNSLNNPFEEAKGSLRDLLYSIDI